MGTIFYPRFYFAWECDTLPQSCLESNLFSNLSDEERGDVYSRLNDGKTYQKDAGTDLWMQKTGSFNSFANVVNNSMIKSSKQLGLVCIAVFILIFETIDFEYVSIYYWSFFCNLTLDYGISRYLLHCPLVPKEKLGHQLETRWTVPWSFSWTSQKNWGCWNCQWQVSS